MLARLALARGDDVTVAAQLALAEPIDDERDPMWSAVIQQIRSLGRLQAGRFSEALHAARLALAWAEKAAAPDAESIQMRCLEGYCLAAVGDGHGAAKAFTVASRRGMQAQTRQATIFADMATADALAAEGRNDEARPLLTRAFGETRALDYTAFYWPVPEVASRLCAQALAADIDVDYVRSIIRTRALAPPAEAPGNWPWACRIAVLGGFRVELDGGRLLTERTRSPGKPLELLRAIVALGGRQVDVDRLVRMLWPGEGRVGARSAFNVTLLRLRRQLRTEDLLVTSDSGVSLNPRLVHVDRWQLEACLATAEMASEDRTRDVMDAVVDRYPGPLLPEDSTPWIEAERARLRLRVDAVLAKGGSRLSLLECGAVLSRVLAADAALPLVAAKLREVTQALR
jgi:DNA-binding SARP family transcriptional activator